MVFFLPAAAFFRGELRARNCFFEQHNNNNKIKIFRRHVRQFWYLPAAGEAAAAAARGLAAWCFSSADVREFLGAVLAAAGGSGTRSSFRSVVFPPGQQQQIQDPQQQQQQLQQQRLLARQQQQQEQQEQHEDYQQPQATESVEKCCFSRISDDTLGSFLARFWN